MVKLFPVIHNVTQYHSMQNDAVDPEDSGDKMRSYNVPEKTKKVRVLLTWEKVHTHYPWSIIFLMGGGYALADACDVRVEPHSSCCCCECEKVLC